MSKQKDRIRPDAVGGATRQLLSYDLDEMIRLGIIKDQHPIIQQLAKLRAK